MVFRRKATEFSFELIKPNEIDKSIDTIIKTGIHGVPDKAFLRGIMSNQETAVTIVAKKNKELAGVVNGMVIKNQPINPQITFVWVK